MTIYLSNRDGDGKTSEEGHYRLQTRFFQGNVLLADDFKVTQNSPTGMSVLVLPGDYRIPVPEGYSYTGWSNANEEVEIQTADPANPRITTIVLYVDLGETTSPAPVDNPNITKLMAIDGSASATPSAPVDATIQSAVGLGNPFIRLANITVGASATAITNANITDLRVRITLIDEIVNATNLAQNTNLRAYPVGSLYFNATNSADPSTYLQGMSGTTWVAWGAGRVPVGFNSGDSDFNTAEATGGAKTHTLTISEMPSHTHGQYVTANSGSYGRKDFAGEGPSNKYDQGVDTMSKGGDGAHNNMQPYIVVYIWKRTV